MCGGHCAKREKGIGWIAGFWDHFVCTLTETRRNVTVTPYEKAAKKSTSSNLACAAGDYMAESGICAALI